MSAGRILRHPRHATERAVGDRGIGGSSGSWVSPPGTERGISGGDALRLYTRFQFTGDA